MWSGRRALPVFLLAQPSSPGYLPLLPSSFLFGCLCYHKLLPGWHPGVHRRLTGLREGTTHLDELGERRDVVVCAGAEEASTV
jgi:hypothetical protein